MLNLNLATKFDIHRQAQNIVLSIIVLSTLYIPAYSQDAPEIPQEFSFLSLNSKALEDSIEFTLDENTPTLNQLNIATVGSIFLITPTKPIKDENTTLKVIADDNTEANFFSLDNGSFFALLNPQKTYSIIQEFKPNCSQLASDFNLAESNIICPDKVEVKLQDNINISEDTSINVKLLNSFQFFQVPINLAETQQQNIVLAKAATSSEPEILTQAQLGGVVNNWKLCIKSRTKRKKKDISSKCLFDSSTIQSIITFQEDFQNKLITDNTLNLAFPLVKRTFKKSKLEYIIQLVQSITSDTDPIEVNQSSDAVLALDNSDYLASFNLGELGKTKTKIKKNTFALDEPLTPDITLQQTQFLIPLSKLESSLTPFDKDNFATLTSVSLLGDLQDSSDIFDIRLSNNLLLKNREISTDDDPSNDITNALQRAQTTEESNLEISAFIPTNTFDMKLSKAYSQIEQNSAPSVDDDTGETVDVVNDKSRLDLKFVKAFDTIDATTTSNIILDIKKPSKQLENSTDFQSQKAVSGFLVPPDLQPVLIEGYRATVTFLMSLTFNKTESLDIIYQELQTKDETPLANAFSFLFTPFGTYNATVKFNGDRGKLFASNGIFVDGNKPDETTEN